MASKEKRIEILNAAEGIIFQKGLKNTNISDIARLAQVPDSAIYQYFKGKEDLLFTIAGERLREATSLLLEHLEGIEDPVSRLRKMIWFNLNYNDTHKQYAHLLLMECRYSKGFYDHEAYTFVRRYAEILLSILKDGVNKSVFCSDIDMRLARDAIFGLLDLEKLNCYAYKEIAATLPDFDDIMSLILPMIAAQPDEMETDKSSRILDAAKKVFSERGYDQATISEIAQLAGVAKGTVYEYFKNKEDLLLTIPQKHYTNYIEKLSELVTIKTPLRKLRRFIRYHFLLHLTDRDFLKVFLVHILYNQLFYDSPVYETFLRYMDILNDILEEGKKDGTIRSDVNNRVFRNLFLGAFSHTALRWLIVKKEATHRSQDRIEELDQIMVMLSRAVATNTAYPQK